VSSYAITFSSVGAYGSFFLNDTLYVGMMNHFITPVIIAGNSAQLGTPILFPYVDYYDLASCQNSDTLNVDLPEPSNSDIMVFPNPTDGIINLSKDIVITDIEVLNLKGQIIIKSEQNNRVNLNNLPNGLYLVKINTLNGSIIKR